MEQILVISMLLCIRFSEAESIYSATVKVEVIGAEVERWRFDDYGPVSDVTSSAELANLIQKELKRCIGAETSDIPNCQEGNKEQNHYDSCFLRGSDIEDNGSGTVFSKYEDACGQHGRLKPVENDANNLPDHLKAALPTDEDVFVSLARKDKLGEPGAPDCNSTCGYLRSQKDSESVKIFECDCKKTARYAICDILLV